MTVIRHRIRTRQSVALIQGSDLVHAPTGHYDYIYLSNVDRGHQVVARSFVGLVSTEWLANYLSSPNDRSIGTRLTAWSAEGVGTWWGHVITAAGIAVDRSVTMNTCYQLLFVVRSVCIRVLALSGLWYGGPSSFATFNFLWLSPNTAVEQTVLHEWRQYAWQINS